MRGAGAVPCMGYASGATFLSLPSSQLILAEGSCLGFLIVFRTASVFPPLGDGKFLCLPLTLAMVDIRKKGQDRSSVLGGSMSPGDSEWQGRKGTSWALGHAQERNLQSFQT